jgi:HEAT repeat protein
VQEVVPVNPTTALFSDNSSMRLRAAQVAGTYPDPGLLDVLVARCAVEPDFFVREMLTWALTRFPAEITVPRLVVELRSERAQARSQALHTLSKIGERAAWPAITRSLLHDADDEVARSAWRAAVVLVPDGERAELATELLAELGRGDRDVRRSLSRALVALSEAIEPGLRAALASDNPAVRAHAQATQRLRLDPDAAFDEGQRVVALGPRSC